MTSQKLTQEQVDKMLSELEEHFQEPVMQMSKYCDAFETWVKCITKNVKGGSFHGVEYSHLLQHAMIDIKKSNLLARLLYGKEKLRTVKCPQHNGHWDGQAMLMGCQHECDGTGWLSEK